VLITINKEFISTEVSELYLYVKLKALASWIFLSFTSFDLFYWGIIQAVVEMFPYQMVVYSMHLLVSSYFWTYISNLTTVVNSVLKFMINGTTSILKS
jgi:hypothetical protein